MQTTIMATKHTFALMALQLSLTSIAVQENTLTSTLRSRVGGLYVPLLLA